MKLGWCALAVAFCLAGTARADPSSEAVCVLDTSGSSARLKTGEKGKLVLTLRPKTAAWHIHPNAPIKVSIQASPGLKPAKTELRRLDAIAAKASAPRFEVEIDATSAGAQQAVLRVEFFFCSESACVKQNAAVTVPVVVS